ncbi:hypothetical protein C1I72_00840 [Ehrlichia canis]|nr:hypothetical protein C1I72_00840 [Ehrlichia canis]
MTNSRLLLHQIEQSQQSCSDNRTYQCTTIKNQNTLERVAIDGNIAHNISKKNYSSLQSVKYEIYKITNPLS